MRNIKCPPMTVNKCIRRVRLAFTLIELLVVIAIISILAALLFPVFSSARENARESSTMTHLQAIQSALALYKLDNHSYPQVLFGYAIVNPATNAVPPMSDSVDVASLNTQAGVSSLYPTYINDYHVFESADNQVDSSPSETVSLVSTEIPSNSATTCSVSQSAGCYTLTPVTRKFYVMDGFDVSPQISLGTPNQFKGGSAPASWQYVIRYQPNWTSIQDLTDTGLFGTSPSYDVYNNNYLDQLRWQNPPGDAYVTSTTYHVPAANKILVLFESGTVAKIDPSQYTANQKTLNGYAGFDDSTSCSNTVSGTPTCNLAPPTSGTSPLPDNPARFWKITNSQ